ncbi:MAG: VWA domain-containing protein [Bacteroidales bacterium]|nr:VWA domain-containing protein [Bacteroidales bacterium]
MTFVNSEVLYLLLLLVPAIFWHFVKKRRGEATLLLPTTEPFRRPVRTLRNQLIHLPYLLRWFAVAMLIVVMARPQTRNAVSEKETEGIDIVLAMDISTSMLTRDLHPSRIDAAKDVALDFVSKRPNDNIGITLFGGEAFTLCPLTTDHTALLSMWPQITCSWAAQSLIAPGTAIGMGLTNALSHLEHSKSKSKVVILLTDGVNNTGEISPMTAAEIAREQGVCVYTIAVGAASGKSAQTVATLPDGEEYVADVENTSDPETLKMIAQTTGGVFYQAESNKKLQEIYRDIDKLEKTKFKVLHYDRRYEAYAPFALAALCALVLEILLRLTLLRRIP